MRLSPLFSWMLLSGLLVAATALSRGQTATGRVAGRIIVAKVEGTVTATNLADHSQRTLANNDALTQNYSVTTGAGSSAILVFSNGATLNLGADSTLSIDEFLQDPFAKDVPLADLKEEPTTSSTKVNLSRGELVGNVKHLHTAQGSTFIVNTPVGAAGIRGTTFRIVFRPDSTGKVFFTLSTADGEVLYRAPAGQEVHVESGKEVVVNVEVKVDTTTGTVTVTAPPVVEAKHDMPAETRTTIEHAAQQIVESSTTVILSSSTPTTSTSPTGDSKTSTPDKKDQKTEDTQLKGQTTSNSSTDPTSSTVRTTSGEGQTQ
jgi:FecR-like protein